MQLEQAIEQYRNSKVDGKSWQHSLSGFVGKKVVDVRGYLSHDGDAFFKLTAIVLDDGTVLAVEGEHDFPYIAADLPGIDGDELNEVYEAVADD